MVTTLNEAGDFELSNEGSLILVASDGKRIQTVRRRSSRSAFNRNHIRNSNSASLQQQLLERAVLMLKRKRAQIDSEASVKLRNIVNGIVDRIFEGNYKPVINNKMIAWIEYSFIRVDFLIKELVNVSRRVTVDLISDVLRRLCPLPPIC